MNRWLTAALALMLLLSPMQTVSVSARAEEAVSAPVEEEVLEADETGAEGLIILEDGEEPEADAAAAEYMEEALLEEAVPEALARYGVVKAGTAVRAAMGDETPLARLQRDSAALILGEADGEVRVAFNTERGVLEGYMPASDVAVMNDEAQSAFLSTLVEIGECALYNGDINLLLDTVPCEWADDVEPESEVEVLEIAEKAESSFSLSEETVVLPQGASFTLVALNLKGRKISKSSLVFESSDPEVATVTKAGLVAAHGVGTAGIAVTYMGERLVCAVTVPEEPEEMTFGFDGPIVLGAKAKRTAPVPATYPEGTASILTWTTSDKKLVTVNKTTGEIKAVKPGTATITATASNGIQASYEVEVRQAPTKVMLDQTALTLAEGSSAQLHASIPEDCVCDGFTYTSNKDKVATVSEDGTVTGVAKGTAKITVKTYNGKKATCTVTVFEVPDAVTMVRIGLNLGIGQTTSVKAIASRAGVQIQTPLNYYIDEQSENPECVSLDARTGKVTALSVGHARIGVRADNGVEGDAFCEVEVNDAVPKKVSVESALTVGVGESGHVMNAVVDCVNGEVIEWANVEWISSAPKKLAVDSETGELNPIKAGTYTITAKTYNGKTAECQVTVMAAPTKVSLKPANLMLSGGGMNFKLTTTVTGKYPGQVTYTSSDESVATVDAAGVITTGSKGTATITASTYNGKTSTCKLIVLGVPARAFFDKTSATVVMNDVVKPTVSVQAADGSAAQAEVSFSVVSGDESCIAVDNQTGAITALRPGEVVLSAQTHNGVVSSNTFTLVVKRMPVMLSRLSASSVTLGVGEVSQMRIRVDSGSADEVVWSSSKDNVASVDQSGRINALETGSAVITAASPDSSVSCRVTVKKAPTKVTISPATLTLTVGATAEYTVSYPSGCGGSCDFESTNTSVATIDEDGVVTAKKVGTTNIIVTSYNGCQAAASLTVTDTSSVAVPKEMKKLGLESYQSKYYSGMSDAQLIEYVIYVGQNQLGMPYIYGAGYSTKNPKGFDCSGFTYWCYKHIGEKLGNSAYKQGYNSGYTKISSISDLKRGDIVCFNTVNDDDLSDHVGIYLGKGYFIHASSAGGKVMLSSLSKDYYKRNFSWARRIVG